MKAIELLHAIMQDAQIAEYGTIAKLTANHGIQPWFGESSKLIAGAIEIDEYETEYLALWYSEERTAWFIENNKADAIIATDEDRIHLYKIEK